jgi:PDZ domain
MKVPSQFKSAAIACVVTLGCAVAAHAKDPNLATLTVEHFRDTATVKEDAPGTTTTISTENGFVTHTGPLRTVWNDEFLKAVIDQKTGERSFQVYAFVVYSGNLRAYEAAKYESPQGPVAVRAANLGREVANCAVGECTYTERLAFPVEEQTLRRLAAATAPGKSTMWQFKLSAAKGPDYTGTFSSAEIAGLLAKLDQYNNALPAVKASTAEAALKLDFGMSGMAIAASADQTNRAGVLVIAVDRGSAAQKSGLIVGDILYEFDAHPIRGLAELHAAVAACSANKPVAIKLYRGTEVLSLSAQF